MTIDAFLADHTRLLAAAGIATARLDCLVLLEDALNTNRARLLANPDLLITEEQQKALEKLIKRRLEHEPLAYIRNKSEFYGREFYIDSHVLEPRAESETMIDLLKALDRPERLTIIDIGTGSGALAITAKLEIPEARIIAIDIDKNCLSVARRNATQMHADIHVVNGNLLDEVDASDSREAVLLCNLPYVPNDFHINRAATHEPKVAIYGGADGLDLYRQLFTQLQSSQVYPHTILTESLPPQHETLANIALGAEFVLDRSEDFIQVFRMGFARPRL